VCFTLFTDDYKPPKGLISQTFTGATASIFAAQRIVDALDGGDFFGPRGRIETLTGRFRQRLGAMSTAHPTWIAGPFGIGAMIALTPFDGSAEVVRKVLMRLYDNGVIGFVAGSNPMRLRFLPPIGAMEDSDVDAVCDILDQTLAQVATEIGR
jgi:acetylornithine aminotransferase